MLPIGISAPPLRRPWLTYSLIALTVAVFVHVTLLRTDPPAMFCTDLTESAEAVQRAAGSVQDFTCRFGMIPDEVAKGGRLAAALSAIFVHQSLFHLVGNMLFLLAFGPRVEEDLGRAGLLTLYLVGGGLAGLTHVLAVPNETEPSIGASGAVAAVLGAHLLLAGRAELRVLILVVPLRLPTWFVITMWAGQQVALAGLVLSRAQYPAGTSYEVHVAGFALGLLVGALAHLVDRLDGRTTPRAFTRARRRRRYGHQAERPSDP